MLRLTMADTSGNLLKSEGNEMQIERCEYDEATWSVNGILITKCWHHKGGYYVAGVWYPTMKESVQVAYRMARERKRDIWGKIHAV